MSVWMQGEVGEAVRGPRGAVGSHGQRGRPGAVVDATGREIITVKGEKVSTLALMMPSIKLISQSINQSVN